jgi:hypothetical protein
MSSTFRISARVQAWDFKGAQFSYEGPQLEEVKILVIIEGNKTIGDLWTKIVSVYEDLYTEAGLVRNFSKLKTTSLSSQ